MDSSSFPEPTTTPSPSHSNSMSSIPLHRKLLKANLNCTSSSPCTDYYCCVAPSPAADQSQPSPHHTHTHSHAVPYLAAAACALGVLSLILTTCTILLRHRFSRSRGAPSASVDQHHAPVDHPIWHIVTVGLPQSAIDSIPSVKYKRSEGLIQESDCSVCLTGFEDGDHLRVLPKCTHAFHLPCIDTWLRSHQNCPLCRSPALADPPPVNVNLSDSSPNSSSPGPSETPLLHHSDSFDAADIGGGSQLQVAEVCKGDSEKSEDIVRSSAAAAAAADNLGIHTGEGSSKRIGSEEEGHNGISRLIKSSSSIGRSSAKMLSSFRGSKSQSSSTLPHL